MLSEAVYSLGNPGTFDVTDKTDPMYYVARYSHELSVNLYNLQQEGFQWRQEEDTEYDSLTTALDTYGADIADWFTSAVAASNDGLPIPAPPSIPALPGGPLPSIIISLLVRIVVRILVDWLRKKLDPNTEAKEIAQMLKKIFLDADEESLMYLLQSQPLEIMFSKYGDYQDFLYADQPET